MKYKYYEIQGVSCKCITFTGTYKKKYGLLDQALLMLNPKQPLLLFLGKIRMEIFIQTVYLKIRCLKTFQFIKGICEYKMVSFKISFQYNLSFQLGLQEMTFLVLACIRQVRKPLNFIHRCL
jgi:hypothetical protein